VLSLRYPKFWAATGWLMIAGVIVGSLIPNAAVPTIGGLSDKAMHASAYFTLMVWFAGFCRRSLYPVIAGVLVALGVGLDLLQQLTATRVFEWYDVAMNCSGVAIGLAASLALLGGWSQRLEQRLLS
jgi:VanZ family protein